jgi:pimeloyl-ACP methyl ester carboxylesterase
MERRTRVILMLFLVPAGLYAALCVLLFFVQRSMIYFPVRESAAAGARAERFVTEGADLKVWSVEKPGPDALLYFGGNAEDVGASVARFAERLPHTSLYFVNYRGYGGSTGSPSERALVADAVAVYDRVHARHRTISVLGRSLGSAVAVQLARRRDVRRLALVTPFDSLVRVAADHMPWMPVGLLLRDRYESAAGIDSISAESLVVVAASDEVIPRARTDALIAAFRSPPRVIVLAGATHNSVDLDPRYLDELAMFLVP